MQVFFYIFFIFRTFFLIFAPVKGNNYIFRQAALTFSSYRIQNLAYFVQRVLHTHHNFIPLYITI